MIMKTSTYFPYFLFFALATLSIGCTEQSEDASDGPFSLPIDFVALADSLDQAQPQVHKTLLTNGTEETLEFSEIEWRDVELVPFIDANFNLPKNKDSYSVETTTLQLAPIKTIIYTAQDSSLPVLKASYTFFENTLTKVAIIKRLENPLFESQQELIYEPGIGFTFNTSQKVERVFEREASILYRFAAAPQAFLGKMQFNDSIDLPIHFTWNSSDEIMSIDNTGEHIVVSDVTRKGDTTILRLPVFQSEFRVVQQNSKWTGFWYDLDRGSNYRIPFTAEGTALVQENTADYQDMPHTKYQVGFGKGEDITTAIGLFENHGKHIYGSFATETGDYRFLRGSLENSKLVLSTFDGIHAYVFTAELEEDGSLMNGIFYSGNHYSNAWGGAPNANIALTDPSQMNTASTDQVAFSLPNLAGEQVTLLDEQFRNKPLLITIMGSWCPNCMDESRLLNELYAQYQPQGLEIVAVAFERKADFEEALPPLLKASKDLNISYPVLFGGRLGKESVKRVFPQLDEIKSYPTLLVLNKNHEIINVHTGFYGPGTGAYYTSFVKEINEEIASLLTK